MTSSRVDILKQQKKKGKSKVLPRGFCLFDSETEQTALQFLHIYCSDVRSHSSAPESNKQNPRDRILDLSIFFRHKHIPSLKNLQSPAPNESSPYWFQGNFAASFVFNFCLREFLLSALVNRFELRCEPKRLMLLYYKICPCCYNSNKSLWYFRMSVSRKMDKESNTPQIG